MRCEGVGWVRCCEGVADSSELQTTLIERHKKQIQFCIIKETAYSVLFVNSISEKIYPLPDETTIYPGHGPETKLGREKKENPYLNGTVKLA